MLISYLLVPPRQELVQPYSDSSSASDADTAAAAPRKFEDVQLFGVFPRNAIGVSLANRSATAVGVVSRRRRCHACVGIGNSLISLAQGEFTPRLISILNLCSKCQMGGFESRYGTPIVPISISSETWLGLSLNFAVTLSAQFCVC